MSFILVNPVVESNLIKSKKKVPADAAEGVSTTPSCNALSHADWDPK